MFVTATLHTKIQQQISILICLMLLIFLCISALPLHHPLQKLLYLLLIHWVNSWNQQYLSLPTNMFQQLMRPLPKKPVAARPLIKSSIFYNIMVHNCLCPFSESEATAAGALWHIFRREDVPSLIEFLKECSANSGKLIFLV